MQDVDLHKKSPPLLGPEVRLDAELVDGLNHTAEVVAKDFAQDLVDLSRLRPTPYPLPEFRLYHAERGFTIRPLVIMPGELRRGPDNS